MGKSTIAKFGEKVLGRMSQDTDSKVSEAITKKAKSAFDLQVALLTSEILEDENKVEAAEEALEAAIYVIYKFSDNKEYCQKIVNAQFHLDEANDSLARTKTSLEYFKTLLAERF